MLKIIANFFSHYSLLAVYMTLFCHVFLQLQHWLWLHPLHNCWENGKAHIITIFTYTYGDGGWCDSLWMLLFDEYLVAHMKTLSISAQSARWQLKITLVGPFGQWKLKVTSIGPNRLAGSIRVKKWSWQQHQHPQMQPSVVLSTGARGSLDAYSIHHFSINAILFNRFGAIFKCNVHNVTENNPV